MIAIPALQLDDVRKCYPGPPPVTVLRGVTLSVPAGSFCLLEGPSGSGKTTLLSIAAGLEPPSQGRVLVDGRDLSGLDGIALAGLRRQRVGFVFQDFKLIDVLTAEENVTLPLELRNVPGGAARAAAREALERLGLGDRMTARPGTLSGGEKQRVAIARALVTRPALLLADEPTANLDGATGREVAALLREAARERGTTVLVASHDPRLGDLADQTLWLLDGVIDGRGREERP